MLCKTHQCREEIEAHQHKGDNEYRQHGYPHRLEGVRPHGEVLLVEHIEHRVGEHVHCGVLAGFTKVPIEGLAEVGGDYSCSAQG